MVADPENGWVAYKEAIGKDTVLIVLGATEDGQIGVCFEDAEQNARFLEEANKRLPLAIATHHLRFQPVNLKLLPNRQAVHCVADE